MFSSVINDLSSKSSAAGSLSTSGLMSFAGSPSVIKPKHRGSSGSGTKPAERKQMVRGPQIPMVGAVGMTQLSGALIYAETETQDILHIVLALVGKKKSGQPVVYDVPKIFKDDEVIETARIETASGARFVAEAYNGYLKATIYDGSQQSIDDLPSLRGAPGWTEDMIGAGIVLAHIEMRYHNDYFSNGIPPYEFLIDARPVSGGSVQPPLSSDLILQYLQDDFEAADEEIDFDSFARARDICIEPVVTAVGAEEHRYQAGGAYDFDESHADVIEKMLQTCGGRIIYTGGKFSIQVASWHGPADFEISEHEIIGDVTIQPMPERRDLVNIIRGSYTDAETEFQSADFPEVGSLEYIEDDGEELEGDFDLEFVQSPDQAQRLASLELNRARLLTMEVPCNFRAYPARAGSVISLDSPTIGIAGNFYVESWEFNYEDGITLALREDFESLWDDYIGTVVDRPPLTDLPEAGEIDPPYDIEHSEFEQYGEWITELQWEHEAPGSVSRYLVTVENMENIDGEWQGTEIATGETIEQRFRFPVPSAGEFRVTIRAENNFGAVSDPAEEWYTSSIPTLEITSISADEIDVSAFPARALVSWSVDRLEAFEEETVQFQVETRPYNTADWLPVTTTTTLSCWVEGLGAGRHEVRVKGIPPFGTETGWRTGTFEVVSVEIPTNLTLTDEDGEGQTAALLTWSGAGQAWDIEMRLNGVLWTGASVSAREWPVPSSEPGVYVIRVRGRSGSDLSDWAEIDFTSDDLPAPVNLQYVPSPENSGSSGTVSWESGGSTQFISGYEIQLVDIQSNIVFKTMTQSTEYMLPVLAAGSYVVKVRAVSYSGATYSEFATTVAQVEGLATPTDLGAVEEITGGGSTLTQSVIVSWKPGDNYAQSYELEYRPLSAQSWSGAYSGPATSASLTNLEPGDYVFRVRARLASELSGYAQITFNVVGMDRAPDNIEGLQFRALSSSVAMLSWNLMTDPTVLSGGSIHVRHTHLTGESATWESAVPLTERLPGNATLTNVPLLSGTYLVKAVNGFSRWSIQAAIVVSNIGNMLGYNRIVEREEPKDWPGEKFKAQVSEGGSLTLGKLDNLSLNMDWESSGANNGGTIVDSGEQVDGHIVYDFNHPSDSSNHESYTRYTYLTKPVSVGDTIKVSFVAKSDIEGSGSAFFIFEDTSKWEWTKEQVLVLTEEYRKYEFIYEIGTNPNETKPARAFRLDNDTKGSTISFYDFRIENLSDAERPPHYVMEQALDLEAVFTARLSLQIDGSVYIPELIDNLEDNVDEWPMFDGSDPGNTWLQYEVSQTDDDPASYSAVWSEWTQFLVGEFRARAFRLRVTLVTDNPQAVGTLANLRLIADVPDRTEYAVGVSSPAEGIRITYNQAFLSPAVIGITGQDMDQGDRYEITNNANDGFNIRFYNSSGSGIARTFDYIATSYGEQ
ncbi:fibronectin type III domain-containing protein [Endozoicomonas sp. ONNA1]|uniref:fibronectin type III domain-containing protein n=1 Tax=Endozoicomonas sp. ONNA1 TaxID=2828740 RepID=UPI00214882AF|nr:fibronectin type III domain-containing protein [Endozoicomonas sp. ONNA1]